MKCPHCRESFHAEWTQECQAGDVVGTWDVYSTHCAACNKLILRLSHSNKLGGNSDTLVHPAAATRPACPPEVPQQLADDYNEACLVIAASPKAAAALGRRCLQGILHESGIKKRDLASEIEDFIARPETPSHLAESVDAIRTVGNFAAHPIKSKNTGEVLPVEPGEAEWLLDVLDALFDFFYVQPQRLMAQRAALNAKLAEAGKPPMK